MLTIYEREMSRRLGEARPLEVRDIARKVESRYSGDPSWRSLVDPVNRVSYCRNKFRHESGKDISAEQAHDCIHLVIAVLQSIGSHGAVREVWVQKRQLEWLQLQSSSGRSTSAGPTGSSGRSTSAGPTGSSGRSTSAGPTGSSGRSTSAGPTGSSGRSTSAGPTGSSGRSTSAGPTGSSGRSTSAGPIGSSSRSPAGTGSEGAGGLNPISLSLVLVVVPLGILFLAGLFYIDLPGFIDKVLGWVVAIGVIGFVVVMLASRRSH